MSIALTTAFSGSAGAGEAGGAPHRPFSPQGVVCHYGFILRLVNEALRPLSPPTQAPGFSLRSLTSRHTSLLLFTFSLPTRSSLRSPFIKMLLSPCRQREDCSQSCHPPHQFDIARVSDSAVRKDNKVLSLLQLRYGECQIGFTLVFDFLKL